MEENTAHMALFDDVNPAADAIGKLREIGVMEKDIEVISGVPFPAHVLGRAEKHSYVPLLGGFGALFGFSAGIALNFGTPLLYSMSVGGQSLFPLPPGILIAFETTMLGLLVFTFLGVLIENAYPQFGSEIYDPEISDGAIAIIFQCESDIEDTAYEAMKGLGASDVKLVEAKAL